MFHNESLELDNNDPDPTEEFDVCLDLFRSPTLLGPNDAHFPEVAGTLGPWSDQVWIDLGGRLELEAPVAPPPVGDAFTPNMFKRALEPLINRDKEFCLAPRTVARFCLLLGGPPPVGADATDLALLPPLKEDFSDYLRMPSGAAAADELKEITRTAIREANASRLCTSKDVTLTPTLSPSLSVIVCGHSSLLGIVWCP